MVEEKPRFSETVTLKAKRYHVLPFQSPSTDGYYVIGIETIQQRNVSDDIIIEIFDEVNYNLFLAKMDALNAGASPYRVKQPESFSLSKSFWNSLYFKPPDLQKYYLVLDNTHSVHTDKVVKITAYWKPEHSQFINSIKNALDSHGLYNLWSMYEQAVSYNDNGDYASACDNLRKILVILWTKVCEKLSDTSITIPEGKSVDLEPLKKILKNQDVSEYVVSYIARTWSLVSELAHIEKDSGKQPSVENTNLAFNSSLAIFSYLLSLLPKRSE